MHNLRMNFFRYIQRLKQYSLSTSAKHMLSTVIGVLLTSNILSVVLIMLLHNHIATELVGFLCALAAITTIATLLLIFTVCALDDVREKNIFNEIGRRQFVCICYVRYWFGTCDFYVCACTADHAHAVRRRYVINTVKVRRTYLWLLTK